MIRPLASMSAAMATMPPEASIIPPAGSSHALRSMIDAQAIMSGPLIRPSLAAAGVSSTSPWINTMMPTTSMIQPPAVIIGPAFAMPPDEAMLYRPDTMATELAYRRVVEMRFTDSPYSQDRFP